MKVKLAIALVYLLVLSTLSEVHSLQTTSKSKLSLTAKVKLTLASKSKLENESQEKMMRDLGSEQCPFPKRPAISDTEVPNHHVAIHNENLNSQNEGRIEKVKDFVFFRDNVTVENINDLDIVNCPSGYNTITKEKLQDRWNASKRLNPKRADTDACYVYFRDHLYFNNNVLYLLSDGSYFYLKVEDVTCNWVSRQEAASNSEYTKYGVLSKCYMTGEDYPIRINIHETGASGGVRQIQTGVDYDLSIRNTHIKGVVWKYNDRQSDDFEFSINFASEGCQCVHIWMRLLIDTIVYQPKCFFVNTRSGSLMNTKIRMDLIDFFEYQASAMIFSSLNFAINSVQFTTDTKNRIVMSFTDKNDLYLYVLYLDNNLHEITRKNLGKKYRSLDIISSINGFSLLCVDLKNMDRLTILQLNGNLDIIGEIEVINYKNNDPTKPELTPNVSDPSEGIYFHKSDGKRLFGLENSYKPIGGTLMFRQGKIGVLFSHMNNFGTTKTSFNRVHAQGNSFYIFDSDGSNPKIAYSWGVSPTLNQQIVYVNEYFYTASLGSLYPPNIQICKIHPVDLDLDFLNEKGEPYRNKTTCALLFPHNLPIFENKICAKMGTFIRLNDNKLGVVYSISPCGGSTTNEVGMAVFDTDLNVKEYIIFGHADKIVCIKSGMYGKNIVITYTIFTDNETEAGNYDWQGIPINTASYIMLVDIHGKVINTPMKLEERSCDNMFTMIDGATVQTWITETGNIGLLRARTGEGEKLSQIGKGIDVKKSILIEEKASTVSASATTSISTTKKENREATHITEKTKIGIEGKSVSD